MCRQNRLFCVLFYSTSFNLLSHSHSLLWLFLKMSDGSAIQLSFFAVFYVFLSQQKDLKLPFLILSLYFQYCVQRWTPEWPLCDEARIWVSMTCSVYSIEGTVPLSCQNLAGHCYSLLDTSLKYLGLSGCSRRLQSSPDSSSERHQPGDFFSHRCQAPQSKCAFPPCFSQRTTVPDTDHTNHKE